MTRIPGEMKAGIRWKEKVLVAMILLRFPKLSGGRNLGNSVVASSCAAGLLFRVKGMMPSMLKALKGTFLPPAACVTGAHIQTQRTEFVIEWNRHRIHYLY